MLKLSIWSSLSHRCKTRSELKAHRKRQTDARSLKHTHAQYLSRYNYKPSASTRQTVGKRQSTACLTAHYFFIMDFKQTPKNTCTHTRTRTHRHAHRRLVKWRGPDWQLLWLSSSLKRSLFLLSVLSAPNWQPAASEQLFSSTCLLVPIIRPPKWRQLSAQKTAPKTPRGCCFFISSREL